MTVAELRHRMTTVEKAAWVAFDHYRQGRRKQNWAKDALLGKAKKKKRNRHRV